MALHDIGIRGEWGRLQRGHGYESLNQLAIGVDRERVDQATEPVVNVRIGQDPMPGNRVPRGPWVRRGRT